MLFRLFLFALLIWSSPALAEKRIALLIGNAAYDAQVGALTNPLNDIRLVGDALRRVGFDILEPIKDATRTDILVAVQDYAERLKDAGPDAVGFLYYSGHGVASSGENYLVPVDVKVVSRRRMVLGGVKQNELIKILRDTAPLAAHYLVFDACRNNLGGSRGSKGFVPIAQESGLLVAFATAPGQVASDLGKGGGPYAKALASEIVKPGIPDLLMFHRVRIAVSDATDGGQIPWTMDGIQRPERLMLGGKTEAAATVRTEETARPPMSDAARAWDVTKDTKSKAVLARFIELYPGTVFAELARARLSELDKVARLSVPEPEAKYAEAPSEESQSAPQAPASAGDDRATENSGAAAQDQASPKRLANDVQSELKRLGCYRASVDGVWGPGSRSALEAARRSARTSIPRGDPSPEMLVALRRIRSAICTGREDDRDAETARLPGGTYRVTDGRTARFTCQPSGRCSARVSAGGFIGAARLYGRINRSGVFSGHWVIGRSLVKCPTRKYGSWYWGRLRLQFNASRTAWRGHTGHCNGRMTDRSVASK